MVNQVLRQDSLLHSSTSRRIVDVELEISEIYNKQRNLLELSFVEDLC